VIRRESEGAEMTRTAKFLRHLSVFLLCAALGLGAIHSSVFAAESHCAQASLGGDSAPDFDCDEPAAIDCALQCGLASAGIAINPSVTPFSPKLAPAAHADRQQSRYASYSGPAPFQPPR